MRLFRSVQTSPELLVDAQAKLVTRPATEGEMSGSVAEAIAFLPNLLALPGFVLAIVELVEFFRSTDRESPPIEVSGPRGRFEISSNVSPEQFRQVIDALIEEVSHEEDPNGNTTA